MSSLPPPFIVCEIEKGSRLPRKGHSVSAATCGIALVPMCKRVSARLLESSRGYLGLAELFLCVHEGRK